jgi:diguanylate cyclase (GGDEF)-like protein
MDPFEEQPEHSSDESLSIRAECTVIIFRRRPEALLSHLLVALLTLWIGWNSSARVSNLIFVGLLVAYVIYGTRSARSFNARQATEESARRAARELYIALAALGIIYNLIFLNLDLHGVPYALDYQLLILSLYAAGAAASYQHLPGLAIVFILSAIGPLTVYQLLRGGQKGAFIGILLVIFVTFMSRITIGLHQDVVERLRLTRELRASKEAAERQARVDGLTGLLNRTAFFESGRSLIALSRRHQRPLSVVMADLDHFKMVNDRFGHSAGDVLLAAFAETLRKTQRSSDVCARLGGEEFAILLPETSAAAAIQFAERVRESLATLRAEEKDSEGVTASFGIAELAPSDASLDTLIDRADRALYKAKAEGRNRTIAAAAPRPAAVSEGALS